MEKIKLTVCPFSVGDRVFDDEGRLFKVTRVGEKTIGLAYDKSGWNRAERDDWRSYIKFNGATSVLREELRARAAKANELENQARRIGDECYKLFYKEVDKQYGTNYSF